MRPLVDAGRLRLLMRRLGQNVRSPGSVYFTGGATALLLGWRESTIDVDLKLSPESDEILRQIQWLKNDIPASIELASPDDFIPMLPGWEGRSLFISQEGPLLFFHYDLYSQALSKIERGHDRDLSDVREMLGLELVKSADLLRLFDEIEPLLFRFPGIDPGAFRARLIRIVGEISISRFEG